MEALFQMHHHTNFTTAFCHKRDTVLYTLTLKEDFMLAKTITMIIALTIHFNFLYEILLKLHLTFNQDDLDVSKVFVLLHFLEN